MDRRVAGSITRKSMLRRTGVEYGDFTMNHVLGCSHGCKFPCYAYLMKKRFGEVTGYEDWCKPRIVSNTLELLDKEIPKLKNKIRSVQLCFSTDPFMYRYPEVADLSVAAIRKLNEAGIKCTVLTKGLLPFVLNEFSPENEYGITLVSLDESFREKYEPESAPYGMRIASLAGLKKTWVSIEPYPTPNIIEQNLEELLWRVSSVDKIVFGRWNYNSEVSKYPDADGFYRECARKVREFCADFGIECIIKKGTE